MRRGRILKGVGSFYTVLCEDGSRETCKARGRFRNEGVTPMVGDLVEINDGSIERILPRKNQLVRPMAANIDGLVIVLSASTPKPDWLLVDKLIIAAKRAGIAPLLALNKLDQRQEEIFAACEADYAGVLPVVRISCVTGEGLDALKELLAGKICCLAGQSAVGKSSLLNALMPELALPVGDLSKKTERGRHTTRHAELIPFAGGALVDTPGFSLFENQPLTQQELDACYPEFGQLPEDCRFFGCSHINEPGCAVRQLAETGGMSPARYARYVTLCQDFIERRKHRYD